MIIQIQRPPTSPPSSRSISKCPTQPSVSAPLINGWPGISIRMELTRWKPSKPRCCSAHCAG